MSNSGNNGRYPLHNQQYYSDDPKSRLKKFLSNVNSLGVGSNALLDALMSYLEIQRKFLYPPASFLAPAMIFKTGGHAYLYIKVTQTAGIAALAGMGYAISDMYNNGINRSNALTLSGNSFFLAESVMLSRAMFFAHNLHKFHRFGMIGAGLGGIADGIKATNYWLDKDYKSAAMYGALSIGNVGMMLFANHHRGAMQNFLWHGFRRMPPYHFLMAGFAIWGYKNLYG